LGCLALSSAQASPYPAIRELQTRDPIYAQLAAAIEQFRATTVSGGDARALDLSIYRYALPRDESVFELAAAFSLPYDALVTLNRLGSSTRIAKGTTLLVPSVPGVFVSGSPDNDLEYLMTSLWSESSSRHYPVRVSLGGRHVDFMFYPGETFHAAERVFFLVGGFRFPLPKGVVTSGFGMRPDPFNGKVFKFHTGIDIAAPMGTEVYAARTGKVESTGWSDVYGNFVLILHDNGWESLYGHLSRIIASRGATVQVGSIVGLVGSTGLSTGPHLHFEVRRHGVAVDPAALIPGQ
jgi:murein DD-endopeptidase MepM/ murein hydrolase activator NlpD